jgi:glutamate/tyrosine decarboxylase-like PLP-dependent enzyme
MSLKEHGVHKYARLIEQNVAQAQALAARVAREPELELLAPAGLNIVCFRYRGGGGGVPRIDDPIVLNALNQQLLVDVQVSGVAVPSSTVLEGRFALRCAVVNHRSRHEDFDLLVDAVLTEGRRLAGAADRSPSR